MFFWQHEAFAWTLIVSLMPWFLQSAAFLTRKKHLHISHDIDVSWVGFWYCVIRMVCDLVIVTDFVSALLWLPVEHTDLGPASLVWYWNILLLAAVSDYEPAEKKTVMFCC